MYWSSRARSRGSLGGEAAGAAAWEPVVLGADNGDALADGVPNGDGDPAAEASAADAIQAQIDEAYQMGHADGLTEGRAAEAERLESVVRACQAAITQLQDDGPGWMENLEKNLVALATAIAREIISREIKGSAEDITALVREAVSDFPITAALKIRMNPADLTAISSPLGNTGVDAGPDVRWIPDPSVAIGGCVVEGPDAIVDGRVEKALDRIYTKLVYG